MQVVLLIVTFLSGVIAQDAIPQIIPLPTLRQQAAEMQSWRDYRVYTILPSLLKEFHIDMWLMVMQEYREDFVWFSLANPTDFSARRRSAFLIYYDQSGNYQYNLIVDITENLWDKIAVIINAQLPQSIALNVNEQISWSDGLSSGQYSLLLNRLQSRITTFNFTSRLVYEPKLATSYTATLPTAAVPRYQQVMETAHALITQAFSNQVITPGETTTTDVEWWLREQVQALGMTVWFQPDVETATILESDWHPGVIEEGSLIWVDFGVIAYRLKTDTQHMGYVLREGETDAPKGFYDGLGKSNRFQDIFLEKLKVNLTGDEVLNISLEEMRNENINGTLYSHTIGDWGHGPGNAFGLWDQQDGVPYYGSMPVRALTWISVELAVTNAVPEWNGNLVDFRQEEDIYLDEMGIPHWVYQRQSKFHLVAPLPAPKETISRLTIFLIILISIICIALIIVVIVKYWPHLQAKYRNFKKSEDRGSLLYDTLSTTD